MTRRRLKPLLSMLLGLSLISGATPAASDAVPPPVEDTDPPFTIGDQDQPPVEPVPPEDRVPLARENPFESPVQERVDVTRPTFDGRTFEVKEGDDLQVAIDSAAPGDIIELEPGAVFTGSLELPVKENPDGKWILIRTAGMRPPEGQRIDPSVLSASMAIIQGQAERPSSAIKTAPGANHYRFENLTIRAHQDPTEYKFRVYNLVDLSAGNVKDESGPTLEHLPHHIVFDRVYVYGNPNIGTRRGFTFNGRHLAVINSYVTDFMERGADSQAIAGWSGSGPFRIENNFLAGAGENVMFGGSNARIEGLVPSDIEIVRNDFYKPLSWNKNEPEFEGKKWVVKNLLELKNGQRVLIEGNTFENNWGGQGQGGHAVLLTPRTSGGKNPWAVVQDVLFQHNTLINIGQGFNILGEDTNSPNGTPSNNIVIHNNLFENVGAFKTRAYWLKWTRTTHHTTISNNTVRFGSPELKHGISMSVNSLKSGRITQATDVNFVNNVIEHQQYGFKADRFKLGTKTLDTNFPGLNMSGNIFLKKPGDTRDLAGQYPNDSSFTNNVFVDADEPYDPGEAGVDMELLLQKQRNP